MTVFLAHGVAEDKMKRQKKKRNFGSQLCTLPKSNAVSYKYKTERKCFGLMIIHWYHTAAKNPESSCACEPPEKFRETSVEDDVTQS